MACFVNFTACRGGQRPRFNFRKFADDRVSVKKKSVVSFRKMSAVLLFSLFLPGCASQGGFSKSFPKRLTHAQNEWRFKNRVNPDPAPVPKPVFAPLQPMDGPRVQQILDRIVYVSPLRGYPVRAGIIQDPKINAFTDGLTIFVNTGLLNAFQYHEDLVAAVLAHELGHILGHHLPEEKSRSSALVYLSYLTPALSALPYGGIYGSLSGTALRQGARIRDISYSRLQENEADSIGAILADEAGYNAYGLCDFFDVVSTSGFGRPQSVQIPLSVGAIPESAAVALLSSSPLYRVHPPSKKRKELVRLLVTYKKGILPFQEMKRQSGWLADLYLNLERRLPA